MLIYFDTNVYSYISAVGEVSSVQVWLKDTHAALLASDLNLFEVYAIPDSTLRKSELRTITKLAAEYSDKPTTWREALEVRYAVARLRPEWINRQPQTRNIRELLRGHRAHWDEARRGVLPDPAAYEVFRKDFEAGVQRQRNAQKQNRQLRLKDATDFILRNLRSDTDPGFVIDVDIPDDYWRLDCFWSWHNAVIERSPWSRDYTDWLLPYLKPSAFQGVSYARFWLKDVDPAEMPHNHLSGLISFHQLEQKITHGNAVDQSHAGYALLSDLVVTCDRGFADSLTKSLALLGRSGAKVLLLDRAAASAASQLAAI